MRPSAPSTSASARELLARLGDVARGELVAHAPVVGFRRHAGQADDAGVGPAPRCARISARSSALALAQAVLERGTFGGGERGGGRASSAFGHPSSSDAYCGRPAAGPCIRALTRIRGLETRAAGHRWDVGVGGATRCAAAPRTPLQSQTGASTWPASNCTTRSRMRPSTTSSAASSARCAASATAPRASNRSHRRHRERQGLRRPRRDPGRHEGRHPGHGRRQPGDDRRRSEAQRRAPAKASVRCTSSATSARCSAASRCRPSSTRRRAKRRFENGVLELKLAKKPAVAGRKLHGPVSRLKKASEGQWTT